MSTICLVCVRCPLVFGRLSPCFFALQWLRRPETARNVFAQSGQVNFNRDMANLVAVLSYVNHWEWRLSTTWQQVCKVIDAAT